MNRLTDGPTAAIIGPYGTMMLILVGRKTWGYHQDWNTISHGEFKRCLGINTRTVKKYLALLQGRDWWPMRTNEKTGAKSVDQKRIVPSPFDEANAPLLSKTAKTSQSLGAVKRTRIEYRLNPKYDDEKGRIAEVSRYQVPRSRVPGTKQAGYQVLRYKERKKT